MSTKEQRRQKKLAKKKSKEIARRKVMAREKNAMQSLAGQMKAAAAGPIDLCLISEGNFNTNHKLGTVYISRKLRDGRIVAVKFLIDGMCLGVKDIAPLVIFPADQKDILEQMHEAESFQSASPERARKYVESAIAYARQFGLGPHSDYVKVEAIWGNIDADACDEEFVFGDEEGKPRYVNGPFDSSLFQRQVLEKLQTHAGDGNYNYDFMGSMSNGESPEGIEMEEFDSWYDDPELDVDIDQDVDGSVLDGRVIEDQTIRSAS